MGQALLPEHFYAQEQALRDELNLRLRMQSLPSFGIGTLQWDGFQLLRGVVSIQEMTLVLPTGTLIDVPGNTAPAFLNLNATGATRTPLFVHLQSGHDVVSVGRGELAEEGIERVLQRIELSTNPYSATAAQSFRLAEFDCAADGSWSLRPDYVPPLLLVGTSPFMEAQIERMEGVVRALRQVLASELQENYLAAESQGSARDCMRGLFDFQSVLVDLRQDVRPHPYELFRALRSLYVNVCMFREVQPVEIEKPYKHEEIAPCFAALLERIEEQVDVTKQTVPYREFQRTEGLLECEIERDVRRAKDVFLLVQKPAVSTQLDLTKVKLASESRIHVVYERALRGIPFQHIDNPPFHHGLASTVEFYSITPGQEWDYAVREGKVVLFDAPQLQGARLYLYWRAELLM
jgi:type VI secretion system protein ImpJ